MKASESVKQIFSVVNFKPEGSGNVTGNIPTMIASGTSTSSANCSDGVLRAAMSATPAAQSRSPATATAVRKAKLLRFSAGFLIVRLHKERDRVIRSRTLRRIGLCVLRAFAPLRELISRKGAGLRKVKTVWLSCPFKSATASVSREEGEVGR